MSKIYQISRKFKVTEDMAKSIYASPIFSTVKTVKITSYLLFKTKKTAYVVEMYQGRGTFLRTKNFYKTDEGRLFVNKAIRLRGWFRTGASWLVKKLNKANPLKHPRMVIERQAIRLDNAYKHVFMALEVVPPENGQHFAGFYFEVERQCALEENATLEKLMGTAYGMCKFLKDIQPLNISFLAERINSIKNGGEACLANTEDEETPAPKLVSKKVEPITLDREESLNSFLGSLTSTNDKEPPLNEKS